jgi:hypothetical protein
MKNFTIWAGIRQQRQQEDQKDEEQPQNQQHQLQQLQQENLKQNQWQQVRQKQQTLINNEFQNYYPLQNLQRQLDQDNISFTTYTHMNIDNKNHSDK